MAASLSHALVLAAGLGVRLQPLTGVRAKPAIPVAGEPIIRRITTWLVRQNVSDIVVNLHHLPHTITAVLGDGTDLRARVRYSWEQPIVLGSAGGPRRALPIIGADSFFIVNGDTLTDLSLAPLAAAHAASGALVTLALTPNSQPQRYGGVLLERDEVVGFVPRGNRAAGSYHFIGVQAASAAAFEGLSDKTASNSVGGAYDALIAAARGSVRGFVCDASFHDIGTVADYVATSRALSPEPRGTIFWDDVRVGEGAVLDDCIVTDGVRVPPGAAYRHAVLMRGPGDTVIASPWTDDRV